MKLSTKGRYGVRAMFELARNHSDDDEPIALKRIAEKQNISEHYLEQLMARLRKANLVRSIRGAYGGYLLAKDPDEISVGDIIRVLEGPIAPVDCVADSTEDGDCEMIDSCVVRLVWDKVKDSINEVLNSVTLADLCQRSRTMSGENPPGNIFHI